MGRPYWSVDRKGGWRYMAVQINRSDQLIGSNWIRKSNPVCCPLWAVCCPPWAVGCQPRATHRGQVKGFGAKCTDFHYTTTREICLSIFFESCWAYRSHFKNVKDLLENRCILLTGIFRVNISVSTAKYFHTLNIICFCKSLIVSLLVDSSTVQCSAV